MLCLDRHHGGQIIFPEAGLLMTSQSPHLSQDGELRVRLLFEFDESVWSGPRDIAGLDRGGMCAVGDVLVVEEIGLQIVVMDVIADSTAKFGFRWLSGFRRQPIFRTEAWENRHRSFSQTPGQQFTRGQAVVVKHDGGYVKGKVVMARQDKGGWMYTVHPEQAESTYKVREVTLKRWQQEGAGLL